MAIEDNQFLEHRGVSVKGILRAFVVNLMEGRIRQGGSTLTQQMVKNYFLTHERTISRKVKEIFLSVLMETILDKDQILNTYINIIYLGASKGRQIIGVEAASQNYFSKPISKLNLAECALLAGIIQSPGRLNPLSNPEGAIKRRNRVLSKMVEHGFITDTEQKAAETQTYVRTKIQETSVPFPGYFVDAVMREARLHDVDLNGAKIFTTFSEAHHSSAKRAVDLHLKDLEKRFKLQSLETAIVSADTKTGQILSLIGGRSFRTSPFNRALLAKRQMGSTVKPFVYLSGP